MRDGCREHRNGLNPLSTVSSWCGEPVNQLPAGVLEAAEEEPIIVVLRRRNKLKKCGTRGSEAQKMAVVISAMLGKRKNVRISERDIPRSRFESLSIRERTGA